MATSRRPHTEETKKKLSDVIINKRIAQKITIVDIPFGKTKEQHNKYYARWREINRDDYNEKRKAWADKHREKRTTQARTSHLKNKFGLTIEDYENMLITQDYKCDICKIRYDEKPDKLKRKVPNLYVDHCHKNNKVRGLLCHNCNTAIGHLNDNIDLLKEAINYLTKFSDDKALNIEQV